MNLPVESSRAEPTARTSAHERYVPRNSERRYITGVQELLVTCITKVSDPLRGRDQPRRHKSRTGSWTPGQVLAGNYKSRVRRPTVIASCRTQLRVNDNRTPSQFGPKSVSDPSFVTGE